MDAVKILGSLLGGGSMSSGLGGQVIGGLLKGTTEGGPSGGLGDILGSALGAGASSGAQGGGLGDLLDSTLSGGGSSGRGLGGILGTVAMAALAKYAVGRTGGGTPDLGALLGGGGAQSSSLDPAALDAVAIDNQAELLIEAMINAAKADGRVDPSEEQKILERLGELDADEMEFVRGKLQAPLDAAAFARRVPEAIRQQVYGTSLLAMELDQRSEAVYLRDLAQALGLDAEQCNAIHREMGAPAIFS